MAEDKKILLTKHHKVIRNDGDFLSTVVDGEAVIMHMESGNYFGLNSVATDIWKIIEQPKRIQDVLEAIVVQYAVAMNECEEDTMPLLDEMHQLGIIISLDK